MCFNASISKNGDIIEKRFDAVFRKRRTFEPIYHKSAFSLPKWPVITDIDPDIIEQFTWGLVPFWIKERKQAEDIRYKTMNARSETLWEKPSYRASARSKRCLVIVDGFYEWRLVNGRKYPYYITMPDHSPFALAGLWETWMDERERETLETFTVITTKANPLLEMIHNTKKRMPVIFDGDIERAWLDHELERDELEALLMPYQGELKSYTISKLITDRTRDNNVPMVMSPYKYREIDEKEPAIQYTLF